MLDKTKNFIYGINENHFSYIVLAIAVVVSYFAAVTQNGLMEVLGNSIIKSAVFLVASTGLTALYGTIGLNVKEEIKTNPGLATLLAGLFIGLGFALGG